MGYQSFTKLDRGKNTNALMLITEIVVITIYMVISTITIMQQLYATKVYITKQLLNFTIITANPSCISGSLSLVDKILKIFVFGQWHTLCGNTWTLGQAKVACRQLGRNPIGMIINI